MEEKQSYINACQGILQTCGVGGTRMLGVIDRHDCEEDVMDKLAESLFTLVAFLAYHRCVSSLTILTFFFIVVSSTFRFFP